MQIKKFEAVDMPEAISMIKSELGSDAVILSTRTVRKGRGTFGLFGRSMVEVTAAVDPEPSRKRARPFPEQLTSSMRGSAGAPEFLGWMQPLKYELQEIRSAVDALQTKQMSAPDVQRMIDEVSALKRCLPAARPADPSPEMQGLPASLQAMGLQLVENDVDPRSVHQLLTAIRDKLPRGAYESSQGLEKTLRNVLGSVLRVQDGIRSEGPGPKKVALIGPTGVGKTTTIAKIAANHALDRKQKVALVTIDTYRIAAIEQLKIYAKIIGIPVDVVVHRGDLDRTFLKHRDKDLILVDTAGRSHRNLVQLNELRHFLEARQDMERHLVVSTTTKPSDLTLILRNFKSVGYQYLLFTKIDEAGTYGPMLNAVLESGKPLSYLTDGQRVPEDIRVARSDDVMDLILAKETGQACMS